MSKFDDESAIVISVVNRMVGKVLLSVKTNMQLRTFLVSIVCEMEVSALTPRMPIPVELCISMLKIFILETCMK